MAVIPVAVLAAAVLGLAAAAAPAPGAPADVAPFGLGAAAGQSSTTLSSATATTSSLTLSGLTLSTGTYVVGLFDSPAVSSHAAATWPPFSHFSHGFSDWPAFYDSAAWSAGAPDLHGLWVVTQAWHAGTATDADVVAELRVLAARGVITDEWVRAELTGIRHGVENANWQLVCLRAGC